MYPYPSNVAHLEGFHSWQFQSCTFPTWIFFGSLIMSLCHILSPTLGRLRGKSEGSGYWRPTCLCCPCRQFLPPRCLGLAPWGGVRPFVTHMGDLPRSCWLLESQMGNLGATYSLLVLFWPPLLSVFSPGICAYPQKEVLGLLWTCIVVFAWSLWYV